jgi:hypothetical protein
LSSGLERLQRLGLQRRVLRLVAATITYNVVDGVVAITAHRCIIRGDGRIRSTRLAIGLVVAVADEAEEH